MGTARTACLGVSIAAVLVLSSRSGGATPPTERNPFAAAADQVGARFSTIQSEIDRLTALSQATEANAMRAQLQHFKDELGGAAPSNQSGPSLDIVECYQGAGDNGVGSGTASVHLNATDRPVTLALGSYRPVTWNLALDPGAQLQKVILTSYETPSVINGLPPGVPVVIAKAYVGHGFDYESYPEGERFLRSLIPGATVSSV